MTGSDSRMLGEVKGSLESLTANVERLLDGQETARKEMLEASEHFRHDLKDHRDEDERAFLAVRQAINMLEPLKDMAEGHGVAILEIEKWRADCEMKDRARKATEAANKRWQRAAIGGASLVSGAVGVSAGPKFLKWIASLIH